MSTVHSSDPFASPPDAVVGAGMPTAPESASTARDEPPSNHADPQLVRQTKHEIRTLVREITELAQSDCTLEEFFDGFLTRLTSALASVGGAIWTLDESGQFQLRYQANLAQTGLTEDDENRTRHELLLRKVLASGTPTLVPPRSGSTEEDAGNPTNCLLVLAGFQVDTTVHAIVEVFQRGGSGPTTQRGYLRFLVQMCDLASDFMKNRRLRHFDQRQSLWEQLEQFTRTVHHSLDLRETIYTIANEGRRLTEADRVSVVVCRGRKKTIEAVSGLDNIDRRAAEVKQLGKLASAVIAADEPLWYDGDDSDLPPEIESVLHKYLDRSHAKMLGVALLRPPGGDDEKTAGRKKPVGALVFEQLGDSQPSDGLQRRAEIVTQHSAAALSKSLEHNSIFLMPLWRAMGKAKCVVAARNLPITLWVLAIISAIIGSLFCIPADFDLSANGNLRPSERHEIFAAMDGTLAELLVADAAEVKENQPLAKLENRQLLADIAELEGELKETQKQIISVHQMLLSDEERLSPLEEYRLDGQLQQLQVTEASLKQRLALFDRKIEELTLRSPANGQVVTWQLRQNLLRRPVQRGQRLMTVSNPTGDWELELRVPERRMGHIVRAAASSQPLTVTFMLATHPGQEFVGRVVETGRAAEVHGEDGNCVLMRVAIDQDKLPDLRDGARVKAKIHCGRRSLGYVIFQDLIETVESRVLFWF